MYVEMSPVIVIIHSMFDSQIDSAQRIHQFLGGIDVQNDVVVWRDAGKALQTFELF